MFRAGCSACNRSATSWLASGDAPRKKSRYCFAAATSISRGTMSDPATRSASGLPSRREAQTNGVPSHQTRCVQKNAAQLEVASRLDKKINVRRDDIMGPLGGDQGLNPLHGFGQGHL